MPWSASVLLQFGTDCALFHGQIPLHLKEVNNRALGRTVGIAIGVVLACVLPLPASLVNVAASPTVLLLSGQTLQFDVSIANFASNNPSAPWPSQFNLQFMAAADQGPMATLPGSTAQYYSGFQLKGQVMSPAGVVIATFQDQGGSLLLHEGWLATGSGAAPIGMVEGNAGLANSQNQNIVCILLTNMGADIALGAGGAGNGDTLGTSFMLEVSGASGTVQTTGLVQDAFISTPDSGGGALPIPEPNTALMLAPLLAAMLLVFRYHLLARAWKSLFLKIGCRITSSR